MTILFKWPTRGRPKLFRDVLARYRDFISGTVPHRFVISCDEDDATMNNAGMRDFLSAQPNLEFHFNPPPQTKITGINANIPADGWDILFLVSDDMIPIVKDFDIVVADDMLRHFPDTDGALWYPDGRRADLWTLAILGRKYYDRFGYIYNPCFRGFYCDNEAQAVGLKLGKLARLGRCIATHRWVSLTGTDDTYRRSQPYLLSDKEIFEARRRQGFPNP